MGAPPKSGFNWLIWGAPPIIGIGGGILVVFALRSMKGRRLVTANAIVDDPTLARYLEQVDREIGLPAEGVSRSGAKAQEGENR